MKKLVSIVIRTLNEDRYLRELLESISKQDRSIYDIEVVLVDSGSTDNTVSIAEECGCRITHIEKYEFSFGRSLNIGCGFAKGDFLVFVSGHCIPVASTWISTLVEPLESACAYTYGRQVGRDTTKFSERQLFEKYFSEKSRIPQKGFFVNNANAAIRKEVWESHNFDEELTGCEDMHLAKTLVQAGYKVGYVAEASVYHIHDETWAKVGLRYEREAIALQRIMPAMHVTAADTVKYIIVGVCKDFKAAWVSRAFCRQFNSIIRFRFAQYLGAYRGHHNHRKLSRKMKEKYFYPRITDMDINHND